MTRYSVVLKMRPVRWWYRPLYWHRGIQVPLATSLRDVGALMPLRMRRWHRAYATRNGWFWLPCTLCRREFGGHEIHPTIPDPLRGEGRGMSICPFCAIDRRRMGIPNGQ